MLKISLRRTGYVVTWAFGPSQLVATGRSCAAESFEASTMQRQMMVPLKRATAGPNI